MKFVLLVFVFALYITCLIKPIVMKKIFTSAFILLFASASFAQSLPNPDFESWYTDTLGLLAPSGYEACNSNWYSGTVPAVTRVDGQGGGYALRIGVVSDPNDPDGVSDGKVCSNDFPLTAKPTSISGFWKYNGTQSANGGSVRMSVFDATGDKIGEAYESTPMLGNSPTFVPFSANVVYTSSAVPSYANVWLDYWESYGSISEYVVFDNLEIAFAAPTGVAEADANKLRVFPTVTENMVYVLNAANNSEVRVVDVAGKVMINGIDGSFFDASGFAAGLYFVQCNGVSVKFIKM